MNDFEKILKQIEKLDLNYSEKEHLEQSAYNSIKIGVEILQSGKMDSIPEYQ